MRVALIGQAAFGEAVYRRLLEQGEDIVGVFYEREGDPLHNLAVEQGVPAHPTQSLRRRDFMQTYADLGAELNVLAFVTVIIPERVLDLPPHGSIQYHPSLLPLHRGRSAINWAIINGETETGITIFWVDRGIDTGPILLQKTAPISPTDTLASLYRNHLFPQGVDGLAEAVAMVRDGTAPRITQDESAATYEPPVRGPAGRGPVVQAGAAGLQPRPRLRAAARRGHHHPRRDRPHLRRGAWRARGRGHVRRGAVDRRGGRARRAQRRHAAGAPHAPRGREAGGGRGGRRGGRAGGRRASGHAAH